MKKFNDPVEGAYSVLEKLPPDLLRELIHSGALNEAGKLIAAEVYNRYTGGAWSPAPPIQSKPLLKVDHSSSSWWSTEREPKDTA
jgi:hypothetical protein